MPFKSKVKSFDVNFGIHFRSCLTSGISTENYFSSCFVRFSVDGLQEDSAWTLVASFDVGLTAVLLSHLKTV